MSADQTSPPVPVRRTNPPLLAIPTWSFIEVATRSLASTDDATERCRRPVGGTPGNTATLILADRCHSTATSGSEWATVSPLGFHWAAFCLGGNELNTAAACCHIRTHVRQARLGTRCMCAVNNVNSDVCCTGRTRSFGETHVHQQGG